MPFPDNPHPSVGSATQFKKGWEGGPGRPKRGIITDEAMDYLSEEHPKHQGKTRARVIAERMVDQAETDSSEREKLMDRVEGKPTQSIEADVKTNERRIVILPPKRADEVPGASAGASDGVSGE